MIPTFGILVLYVEKIRSINAKTNKILTPTGKSPQELKYQQLNQRRSKGSIGTRLGQRGAFECHIVSLREQ